MIVLLLGPTAVTDLTEIREHLDPIEDGLGSRLVVALDELFVRLEEFPRSTPLVAGYVEVRRAIVRGFPYVVFYRHRPERIDVLRVLHAARQDADRPRPDELKR